MGMEAKARGERQHFKVTTTVPLLGRMLSASVKRVVEKQHGSKSGPLLL